MAFIQSSICPTKVEQFIIQKPLQLWGKAEQLIIKEKMANSTVREIVNQLYN